MVFKLIMPLTFFDAKAYLEDKHIYVRTSGKNISKGWIGIDCPFCGGLGQHLGIHKMNKVFSCFQCGKTGNMFELIQLFDNCSKKTVFDIIRKYSDYTGEVEFIERRQSADKSVFPSQVYWKKITGKACEYLEERNFDPEKIHREYKIGFTRKCAELSFEEQKLNFDNRIIIPMFMENKIVSYTARDYFNCRDPKYLNPLVECVEVPTASMVYNLHTVRNGKALIVEGVTDAWRMGRGAISLQGITFSEYQLWVLMKLNLTRTVVLYDQGAEEKAQKLATRLSLFIPDVSYTILEEDDPASLSDQEAQYLKHELIGSI
jgi:DNA primase